MGGGSDTPIGVAMEPVAAVAAADADVDGSHVGDTGGGGHRRCARVAIHSQP